MKKFYFKLFMMALTLFLVVKGMIYFRSTEFVSGVSAIMGLEPVAANQFTWCQPQETKSVHWQDRNLKAEEVCTIGIGGYNNTLLKDAQFKSKIEATAEGKNFGPIEADLETGLFRYKDIIFTSQKLSKILQNSLSEKSSH